MLNKNKIEFFLFKVAIKSFNSLGLVKTRRIALYLGWIFYHFIPIRKKVTIANLRMAFPEKSLKEIKKLTIRNYQNITITFFELLYLASMSKDEILEQVEFVGADLLTEKVSSNKGFLVLTGHLGNWEYLVTALALYIGKGLYLLAKPQRNPYITKWLLETREKFGSKIIELGVSVKAFYQALINNEILGAAGDQRGHKDNPRVLFFNQPTALYNGLEAIALRTESSVLLSACIRQSDFKYKCYMEELSFSDLPEKENDKVVELTQRYISFIEKYAKKTPEQYFWMHKIWKY